MNMLINIICILFTDIVNTVMTIYYVIINKTGNSFPILLNILLYYNYCSSYFDRKYSGDISTHYHIMNLNFS